MSGQASYCELSTSTVFAAEGSATLQSRGKSTPLRCEVYAEMLKRILSVVLRTLKLVVSGLVALWIVSFDPPLDLVCRFHECKWTYIQAHWSSVLLFFVAAPLLLHEFWRIVRGRPLGQPEALAHELSAPHTGPGVVQWEKHPSYLLDQDFQFYRHCLQETVPAYTDCTS